MKTKKEKKGLTQGKAMHPFIPLLFMVILCTIISYNTNFPSANLFVHAVLILHFVILHSTILSVFLLNGCKVTKKCSINKTNLKVFSFTL